MAATGPSNAAVGSSGQSKPDVDVAEAMKALNLKAEVKPPGPAAGAGPNGGLALSSLDLKGIADYILNGNGLKNPRNIICMVGAGISVSAGIPDFRTPGTGLYSQLERFKLPTPESIFSIHFFESNPTPFYLLAKEMWPGKHRPTPTHYFIRLLHEKGLLLRCWSQNIDSLETTAGLPKEKLVAAHGNFDSAHCISSMCGRTYPPEYVQKAILAGEECTCKQCGAYVKPSITFFGEALPDRFEMLRKPDFERCDLLLVMGTSLQVHPFAGLVGLEKKHVPRLLINREPVGEAGPHRFKSYWDKNDRVDPNEPSPARQVDGFVFPGRAGRKGWSFQQGTVTSSSSGSNGRGSAGAVVLDPQLDLAYRDVLYQGDCDAGVRELAALLGWSKELEALIKEGSGNVNNVDRSDNGGNAGGGAPRSSPWSLFSCCRSV